MQIATTDYDSTGKNFIRIIASVKYKYKLYSANNEISSTDCFSCSLSTTSSDYNYYATSSSTNYPTINNEGELEPAEIAKPILPKFRDDFYLTRIKKVNKSFKPYRPRPRQGYLKSFHWCW